MSIATRRGEWMQTARGRAFWPLDPRPNEIDIEEIAHSLGMKCRYGGHCLRFYSVAEHSVLLSRAAPKPHKKWALLHDASEAYLDDLIRPVKRCVTGYAELEDAVMRAICVRFKLHLDMPSIIKLLDRRLLADEQIQNMAPPPMPWSDMEEPLGMTLQFWTPERAKREFLDEFERLTGAGA